MSAVNVVSLTMLCVEDDGLLHIIRSVNVT